MNPNLGPQFIDFTGVSEERMATEGIQLPMFMTAREIRHNYQAFDGDRAPVIGRQPGSIKSTWNFDTNDSLDTTNPTNRERYEGMVSAAGIDVPEPPDVEGYYESDHQLYARKLQSTGPAWPKYLAKTGVRNALSLQDPTHYFTGSLGKHQVLGGHHRLAAMESEDPDQLMPVTFHDNITEAKRDRGELY